MKNLILSVFVLLLVFFTSGAMVFAIDNRVYLEGPSAVAPESQFLVSVFLDAQTPVNAFNLEIVYPQDGLEFLSFDNTGSMVDIWQPQPTRLPNGNLGLSGGILKGFVGSRGLVIKIYFKALNPNKSQMSFIKSNFYLADGSGTEVRAATSSFSLSVAESAPKISSPSVPFQSTPADIVIEKELEAFKTQILWRKILTPLSILVIVFVFGAVLMYNKLKRRP